MPKYLIFRNADELLEKRWIMRLQVIPSYITHGKGCLLFKPALAFSPALAGQRKKLLGKAAGDLSAFQIRIIYIAHSQRVRRPPNEELPSAPKGDEVSGLKRRYPCPRTTR